MRKIASNYKIMHEIFAQLILLLYLCSVLLQ